MNQIFNADLMKIARQSRGLSQSALAVLSGVSQALISKWENALLEPASAQLEKVAAVLRCPQSFFFEADRVFGLPVSVHPMYRKRASVGKGSTEKLEADVNVRLFHFRRLLKSVDLEAELVLPQLDVDEYQGGPEGVAEMVRRVWMVPNGPIRDLVSYIERAGCLVVLCDFDGEAVDGLTVQTSGLPPCIFLNRNQPADRQRFTLAHELGHLVMHRLPSIDMEQEANEFAAALLMPASNMRQAFASGVSIQRLAALKPVWRTSMGALLMRAKTVGVLTANQNSYLWRQMSIAGFRKREPAELDFLPEPPSVLAEIIRAHVDDLGYQMEDMERMLHTFSNDLIQMYEIPGTSTSLGHLTLVK